LFKVSKRQLTGEELGVDDALVKVIARPIHHGDIQILSGLPQGGPVAPIPEGTERVPGFEGVGTILRLGTNAKATKRFNHIINFGSLGSNTGTNIYSLVPNNVALKSVSIMGWFRLTEDEKQEDFEIALSLATNHPELFEVAHEYEFGDFQEAIQHVSCPGKTGMVLLKSPVEEG
jgi:hypothetical protein